MNIHSSAIIHKSCKIHSSVIVGPFVSIGENSEIGEGSIIESHSVIHKNTILGAGNIVGPYVSLGGASQSRHDKHDDNTVLVIGDNNSFHEFVCINRGSVNSGGKTQIGNNNTLMAYVHVGHDCIIGNETVLVNQSTLAGHVVIMDNATIGYSVGVRQFCKVGQGAFINGGSLVVKDVLPYVIVQGNPTRVVGINKIGLERMHFSKEQIAAVQECFRIVFRRNLTLNQAFLEIDKIDPKHESIVNIIKMLQDTERGLVR